MNIRAEGVRRRKSWIRAAVIVAVGAAVATGCASQAKEPAAEGAALAAVPPAIKSVQVAEIADMHSFDPLEQVADVMPSARVDIVAKTAADVLELAKERGAKVGKGEAIVLLDNTDARLQQEQALLARQSAELSLASGRKQWQHNVTKLEQALADATKAYNKMKNDYDRGLVGQPELDQAENAYTNVKDELALVREASVSGLELQVKSSELSVAISERALANYEIQAPIDGILTDLTVQAGMTVAPGMAIGQIQQLDPVRIRALLPAQFADAARGKSELQFYVPGDERMYTGQIAYMADVVDPASGAYELNLSAGNPDLALKPGMKVQVRLTEEEEEQAVVVPTLSIVREGAEHYVFVLSGGKAEKRKVALGRLSGLNQEILSGARRGETLIVSGQHQLKDGEQVAVAE